MKEKPIKNSPEAGSETSDDSPVSAGRRGLLKKAAYTAPAIVALGVLGQSDLALAMSEPPPDGPGSGG